ncbi:MAG: phosphatase PAP2 family protein [Clostridia bacterium]|nr:phosphatase PAP2 family protein [Clostridia bacterium]
MCLLAAFALWTAAVRVVDVRPIGPQGSSVGFAAVNGFVHRLTGVNMTLYTVTDWLGLIPICVAAGFALLGLGQWIGRKSLFRVERSLLALGGFYLAVMAAFVFFEMYVVNYRPVCIEGRLEASYPSSTTMLVMCVMPTAAMQLNARMKSGVARRCAVWAAYVFMTFMVIGRLISGVHWLTDIIGGALLSAGVVAVYVSVSGLEQKAGQMRK